MDGVATGGGILGGAVSLAYATRLLVEAWREKRTTATGDTSAAVTDAAAANSLLLAALQEERAEVQRLSREVDGLRESNGALYRQMQQQRAGYERELQGLREQMGELTSRLEDMQTRIRAGLPTHD